jgi:TPR repeat protein
MSSSSFINSLLYLLVAFMIASCGATPPVDQGAIYYEQGLYDQAAIEWRPLANEGNYTAQYYMGILSRDGFGSTRQSLDDAAQWFLKSAEQGFVPAMVSLAEVLISLDSGKAAESWLILAARWGSTEAIALLQQRGMPVPEPDLYIQSLQDQALRRHQDDIEMMRPPIRKRN